MTWAVVFAYEYAMVTIDTEDKNREDFHKNKS